MGLRDLQVARETVRTSGGDLSLRALSLPEVIDLLQRHGAPLLAQNGLVGRVLAQGTEGAAALTTEESLAILRGLLQVGPNFVAAAIATGADEPDAIADVLRFPLGPQIAAFEKVMSLTFGSLGSGSIAQTVARVAVGAAKLGGPATGLSN